LQGLHLATGVAAPHEQGPVATDSEGVSSSARYVCHCAKEQTMR
jgi:hypothetical protein